MLDVLHVFLEESYSLSTNEHVLRVSAARESIYQNLYEVEYPYAADRPNNASKFSNPEDFDVEDDESEEIKIFNPKARKPYVPPTNVNPDSAKPFGSILDAPIG